MRRLLNIFSAAIIAATLASCSTTRTLQADQYRLARNKIEITNDKDFNPNLLTPYLKQKHRGISPVLYI